MKSSPAFEIKSFRIRSTDPAKEYRQLLPVPLLVFNNELFSTQEIVKELNHQVRKWGLDIRLVVIYSFYWYQFLINMRA
jgi:hypothetical protein